MISYSRSSHKTETYTSARKTKKSALENAPSLDTRVLGPAVKPKSYGSTRHTVSIGYNKGSYQVINPDEIKDIGR
jgi:hypothetical protein